ncbi:MAG: hypothetical protein LWX07_09505, partial [Bacteroidetes bacterium]|nr:hypothetical protein [Bacteroidota bacterium]
VFTTQGWVWISDYDWGWAPYHYGRWWFYAGYGWVWIPGRIWAPNWVCWRESGTYIGWYPVGPKIWWRNHEHAMVHNNVFVSYTNKWIFVDRKNFNEKITNEVRVRNNKEILQTSSRTVANRYDEGKFRYNGPDVKQISKSSGTNIEPKAITHTTETKNSRVDNEKVTTYRHDPPTRTEVNKGQNGSGEDKNRFNTQPKTFIRPGKSDNKKNK